MTQKQKIILDNLKIYDQNFYNKGITLVCGIDEAGRGPLMRTCCCSELVLCQKIHI